MGPVQPAPWNTLAIIGFVMIFVMPIAAIVCGHIALGQIRRTGEQGYGLALAATICGWVLSGVIVLFVILWVGFFVSFLGLFAGITGELARSGAFTG